MCVLYCMHALGVCIQEAWSFVLYRTTQQKACGKHVRGMQIQGLWHALWIHVAGAAWYCLANFVEQYGTISDDSKWAPCFPLSQCPPCRHLF